MTLIVIAAVLFAERFLNKSSFSSGMTYSRPTNQYPAQFRDAASRAIADAFLREAKIHSLRRLTDDVRGLVRNLDPDVPETRLMREAVSLTQTYLRDTVEVVGTQLFGRLMQGDDLTQEGLRFCRALFYDETRIPFAGHTEKAGLREDLVSAVKTAYQVLQRQTSSKAKS